MIFEGKIAKKWPEILFLTSDSYNLHINNYIEIESNGWFGVFTTHWVMWRWRLKNMRRTRGILWNMRRTRFFFFFFFFLCRKHWSELRRFVKVLISPPRCLEILNFYQFESLDKCNCERDWNQFVTRTLNYLEKYWIHFKLARHQPYIQGILAWGSAANRHTESEGKMYIPSTQFRLLLPMFFQGGFGGLSYGKAGPGHSRGLNGDLVGRGTGFPDDNLLLYSACLVWVPSSGNSSHSVLHCIRKYPWSGRVWT